MTIAAMCKRRNDLNWDVLSPRRGGWWEKPYPCVVLGSVQADESQSLILLSCGFSWPLSTSVSLPLHLVPLCTLSHLRSVSVCYSPLAPCLLLPPVLFRLHFCFMSLVLSQRLLSPFLLPILISPCLCTFLSCDFSCACSYAHALLKNIHP